MNSSCEQESIFSFCVCFCNLLQKESAASSSSSSKLVLYSYWQSSCSWRVRFALSLKGLCYEYKTVDLAKGEQFSPEFEKLNPLHYVPVLVDGDVVVSDSYAILLYLEEKYPQRAMLPPDTQQRALNLQVKVVDYGFCISSFYLSTCEFFVKSQVASIISSSIQPLHMLSLLKYIEDKFGLEERHMWAQFNIEKGFLALEKLLKDFVSRYATGEDVYMADVFLAPQIAAVTTRFNIDMSKFPILSRLYESYKALPEFLASSPERQPDAVH
ncbi:hypothetical protein JRO89_XS01G0299800 [Xanthoceras sorbifolium]|uniref:Glutathione transferase n=1 Tax=Xanthoceras sorbifolium TaxID=99658 RepID=A0ABQ8IM65_9ROSI|nr:hypothetical protein JRO89_XS01G0299800 [Xanthoceras sorbifolium]